MNGSSADQFDSREFDSASTVVVIPAFNEERFIASVVVAASYASSHIIVVDDGSTDHTAKFGKASGAEVIQFDQNRGKGAAINAGFARARELRADVVVTLDADAQHDAGEIPMLAKPIIDREADVVIGSRFLCERGAIPLWRQFGQYALTVATNTFSGTNTTDSQSGFRAYSPRAIRLLRFESGGLGMESETQFAVSNLDLRVVEVPITARYFDGNKRNPIVHGLQVLETILHLVVRRRPLAFLGPPGLALVCCGVLVGLSVTSTIRGGHEAPLGSVVLCSTLLVVGLLLGVTGLILNSLEYFLDRMRHDIRAALDAVPLTRNEERPREIDEVL